MGIFLITLSLIYAVCAFGFIVEVNFEGELLFKGLDLVRYKEGKLLFVRTYWQPLAPLPEGLEIKLSLLNEDGEPFAGTPLHPLPTLIWYPPHRWKAGETVKVDTIPWDLGQYFVVALKVSAGGDWRVKGFKASGPIVLLHGDTLFTGMSGSWISLALGIKWK